MADRKRKARIIDDEGNMGEIVDYIPQISPEEKKLYKYLDNVGKELTKEFVDKQMNRKCIFVKNNGKKCGKFVNSLFSTYCPEHTPLWLNYFIKTKLSKIAIERKKSWLRYDKTHPFQDDVPAM